MSELTSFPKNNKHGNTINTLISDPKLYFTIALFAGEAGPGFFPINSGWMCIFCFIGMIALLAQKKLVVRRKFSIVLLIYAVVLLRNISFNPSIVRYYELPCLITAIIILVVNCVFYKDEDIDQIMQYIFTYATILAFLGVVQFLRHPTVRLAVFGGPNGYYKIALLFEVLCFYRFITQKKYQYVAGIVLGLILCIATGSKGGIASMIVILTIELLYYLFNSVKKKGLFIKRIIQIAIITVLGYTIISASINKLPGLSIMLNRASSFLTSDDALSFTSVNSRSYLIKLGLQFFYESPIIGKGARYTFFYTHGVYPYPHNIFVEFLSEQGLIGTIPLIIFVVSVLIDTLKYGIKNHKLFCLFLCFAVYFSGSLFSGNILDAKPIFVFGVLFYNSKLNYKYENSVIIGGNRCIM